MISIKHLSKLNIFVSVTKPVFFNDFVIKIDVLFSFLQMYHFSLLILDSNKFETRFLFLLTAFGKQILST